MPPKKKSGKKKGGKKGGKGKNKEPQITFQEAVLAYRIGLTEKQLEDWKYEEKNLQEQNDRLSERNQRLLEEQEQYMKILIKQSREFEKKNLSTSKIGKDKVMEALAEKWEAAKKEEVSLEDLQMEILKLERQIVRSRKELRKWLEYRDVGSKQRERQIELLEKEVKDMRETFTDMADHLNRNLELNRLRIVEYMEKTLNRQKHQASDKAMSTLDKKDRQEVLDNDWMKDELARYESQCGEIENEVEVIEQENLALMSELFECNIKDLKITRKLFFTQFEEGETLEDGGILEVDLRNISLIDRVRQEAQEDRQAIEFAKSEDQALAAEAVARILAVHHSIDEEQYDEDYDSRPVTPQSDDEDPFDDYFGFDDQDMTEYLQLGPLELKLLSISGEKKPIYSLGGNSPDDIKAENFNPIHWPITVPMLKSATTPLEEIY